MKNSQKEVPLGLSQLFSILHSRKRVAEDRFTYLSLPQHPFDLKPRITPWPIGTQDYWIVSPGGTWNSCYGLLVYMQEQLAQYAQEGKFYLRIVRIKKRAEGEPRESHDLYFEFETRRGVYLSADCNDYSGTGGAGGRAMQSIFRSLGQIYDVKVDTVTFPDTEQGRRMQARLQDWTLAR